MPQDRLSPGLAASDRQIHRDPNAQVSYTGLAFSPDGSRIYLSSVNGCIKVFGVMGRQVSPLYSISLPATGLPRRQEEIPSGLAISEDGKLLYIALNLSNRVGELDTETGQMRRTFEVGVAPFDLVRAAGKLYVSDWGGRRPQPGDLTGPAGRGTLVKVDPVRHIANEGSVSIIDPGAGTVHTVLVGLHPSGMALTPNGRYLLVANASSDTMSIISTTTERVVETVPLRWGRGALIGAGPDALTVDPSGKRVYVCNGAENALAVVSLSPTRSRLLGRIPTGWFPGAVVLDTRRGLLDVANIEGTGSWRRYPPGEKVKYNSHQYSGTISLIPVPRAHELGAYTARVIENNRFPGSGFPARRDVRPIPIPERPGEPSMFHHVVYILKENRTYDQVLGDMKEGNGDASLCIFGQEVTPNQHKISREFALLENTYCCGIQSSDGHQWTDSAYATDTLERSFCNWPRSYPDGMGESDVDALIYSPAGFLWDNVLAHHRTLMDYGEFTTGKTGWKDPNRKSPLRFMDFYKDQRDHTGLVNIGSYPGIGSLAGHINPDTIGWDLRVPDQFRADKFIQDLHGFEQKGRMPDLCIICLPNDHTSGTGAGAPTPAAQVADNDLAFGRIVEAVSLSRFWRDTCILAVEDDPQDGWDHVDGYRTTAYVISPYTKRHAVVGTNYNQVSLLRTIELILGLPPMNRFDASATPMSDCFSRQPDYTPYAAVPNRVPLDRLNPAPSAIRNPLQRRLAMISATLPLQAADQCPDDVLNRILWHAQTRYRRTYPGDAPQP